MFSNNSKTAKFIIHDGKVTDVSLQNTINKLNQEIASVTQANMEKDTVIANLQGKVIQLTQQANERIEVNYLKKINTDLRSKNHILKTQNDALKTQLDSFGDNTLKTQVDSLRREKEDKERIIAQKNNQNIQKDATIGNLKFQNHTLKKQVNLLTTEKEDREKTILQKTIENNELRKHAQNNKGTNNNNNNKDTNNNSNNNATNVLFSFAAVAATAPPLSVGIVPISPQVNTNDSNSDNNNKRAIDSNASPQVNTNNSNSDNAKKQKMEN